MILESQTQFQTSILDTDQELTSRNLQKVTLLILDMLHNAGYVADKDTIQLTKKRRVLVGHIETLSGTKFIKMTEHDHGVREFNAGRELKPLYPVISAEDVISYDKYDLIIFPFMPEIYRECGTLTDLIAEQELGHYQYDSSPILHDILQPYKRLILESMRYETARAVNDLFFYDRLVTIGQNGNPGRIEEYYRSSYFQLYGIEPIQWNDLISSHWCVNGIYYTETIKDLLSSAQIYLDPTKDRLLALCHGDGHSCNIYTNALVRIDGQEHLFAYLDLETFGLNSFLGEIAIFLLHNSVLCNYLIPEYYQNYFQGKKRVIEIACMERPKISEKMTNVYVRRLKNTIFVEKLPGFGTSTIRKDIAIRYVREYAYPILDHIEREYGKDVFQQAINTLQASFLLRFLGVINLSNMSPQDQLKTLCLLIQTISLSVTKGNKYQSPLNSFIDHL